MVRISLDYSKMLSPAVAQLLREHEVDQQRQRPSRKGLVTKGIDLTTDSRQVRMRMPDGSWLVYLRGSLSQADEERLRRGQPLWRW